MLLLRLEISFHEMLNTFHSDSEGMFGGSHHQLIVGKTLIFSSVVQLHVLYHHLLTETFLMLPARHVSEFSVPTNSGCWARSITQKEYFRT